jgi:MOSC domain-containing protein YiiM
MRLVERTESPWSIAEANGVMFDRKDDLDAARALASCPGLSAAWREHLLQRTR